MPQARYVAPVRWLHWLTAGSILVVLVAGIWMTKFEPADEALKLRLYNIHESFGVAIFVMTLARLVVRWRNPPPPLPDDLPALMKLAALANHVALYVLLIVQPTIGFLATNAWGFPLHWFGVVPIPAPVGLNVPLAEALSLLHWLGAMAMLVLLAMHIAAVVFHSFIRRDEIWDRMA
ncbi:MAG: cytochrome b [Acetobacteraceae bacterium]|nr:cytochrome b [Acetobacteraceae bacterium]